MPLATTLALLAGPWVLQAAGWRAWWWLLAAMTAAMALWAACAVPAGTRHSGGATAPGALPLKTRLVRTLSAPAPWLLALAFATYAGQWLAVIGFLPTIYAQGGTALASAGLLAAAAAGVNIIGNVAAGRLLQAGVSPVKLLATGFVAMGFCACVAFVAFAVSPADVPQAAPQPWFPPLLRFAAVLLFSGFGGLIPATLFALAVRAAPGEGTLSTTVGWLQQWSAIGQFVGPPLVAWLAARAGGWHLTWLATGASSLVGCVLVALIGRELARLERLRAAAHGGA
jgi:MFS family permease